MEVAVVLGTLRAKDNPLSIPDVGRGVQCLEGFHDVLMGVQAWQSRSQRVLLGSALEGCCDWRGLRGRLDVGASILISQKARFVALKSEIE